MDEIPFSQGVQERRWFGPKDFLEGFSRSRENDMLNHVKTRQWVQRDACT